VNTCTTSRKLRLLIARIATGAIVDDKASNFEALIAVIENAAAKAVIAPRCNRIQQSDFDRHRYNIPISSNDFLPHQTIPRHRNPLQQTLQSLVVAQRTMVDLIVYRP
jgi:hypothetical protein